MRCMSCGAEMRVLRVERDDTQDFAGYERQTLECTACHDLETRTVFREPAASPPATPVPHHSAPPTSASPADNKLDESEELLRRAIEMVRTPVRGAQPARAPAEPATTPSEPPAPAAAPSAFAAAPLASDATASTSDATPLAPVAAPSPSDAPLVTAEEAELDEGEVMLRRAIDMVRSAPRSGRPLRGLTDGISAATDQTQAMPAKRSPPSRVVRISHDPSFDAAYAARDTTSGLVVIRHQDSARLKAMCERLGWQVIEGEASGTGV
jgi:hypothetical protein